MLSETSYTVSEGNPAQTEVCVQLIGELAIEVSATLTFSEDTATLDDYSNTDTIFTFDSGSVSLQCLQLDITVDDLLENDERFDITLSSPDDAVDVLITDAEVTIKDASVLEVGFVSADGNIPEGETHLACVGIFVGALTEEFVVNFNVEVLTGGGM